MKRILLVLYLLALWAASPQIASADLLRNMDFDSCNVSQWSGAQTIQGRITYPDSANVAQGRPTPRQGEGHCMARVELRNGDDPINSSGERTEFVLFGDRAHAQNGRDIWYGWSVFIPTSSPEQRGSYSIFAQWHGPGGGNQANVIADLNGTVRLYGGCTLAQSQQGGSCPQGSSQVGRHPRGRWVDWAIHVRWSDGTNGRVTVFRDGDQLWDDAGPNLYRGQGAYLKTGIYRGAGGFGTFAFYLDRWRIGTTRLDVDPDIVPPPPPPPNGEPPPPPPQPPPPAAPPPPVLAPMSHSIAHNSTIRGTVPWQTTITGCRPTMVDFFVDNVRVLREVTPPYGDTAGHITTTNINDGGHDFVSIAYCPDGNRAIGTRATVDNLPDR